MFGGSDQFGGGRVLGFEVFEFFEMTGLVHVNEVGNKWVLAVISRATRIR